MNKFRILLLCTPLSILPVTAFASDLMENFQLALDNDPQFRAAIAGHQAAVLAKDLARDLYKPNASLSANAGRTRTETDITTSTNNPNAYALSVLQPVFRYSFIIQNRQADATVSRADAELGVAHQALMLRVSQLYFNVLSALEDLEFAIAERNAISRQLEQARKRFEVGIIAITDVHEARAAYDLAVARVIAAENAVVDAREALREVTGSYPEQLAGLGEELPLVPPEPQDLELWTKVALEQNLQLIATNFATREARYTVDFERSQRYPNLDVVASHGTTDRGISFGGTPTETTTSAVELQLNFPFYQGGLVTDRTRQAAYLYTQAKENLEQQRRNTITLTSNSYRGVIAGISQVQALEQAIVSNRSALEATEAGFEVGTRTIVDVLLAQRNLFGALRDYAQARYQYVLNTLQLKQAAGTLSPEDLQQINRWLVETKTPAK